MGLLATIIAKLLDPISFIVVLVVTLFSRQKWIIPVAAIAGAVVTETVLTSIRFTRPWGQGLVLGLVATGVHAIVCYWLVGLIKRKSETNAPKGE